MRWPTPQKQITMDYGRVRLWGSIAFVIGSALTGKLVSLFDYRAILLLLSRHRFDAVGHAAETFSDAAGESRHQEAAGLPAWLSGAAKLAFSACVCLLQERMPPTMASARYTGSRPVILPPPSVIYGRSASSPKW